MKCPRISARAFVVGWIPFLLYLMYKNMSNYMDIYINVDIDYKMKYLLV